MRHRRKSQKFSRPRAQRKALIRSLLRAVIIYERITTTEAKAKAMRHWVDRLINWAKTDNLHHRRLAYRLLCDHELVKKLFEQIGPRFKDVKGGYTRVLDVGYRKGDAGKMSILELTRREIKEKKIKEKKETKKNQEATSADEKVIQEERSEHKKGIERPKKSIIDGVKRIFKKERDSL
ncbi:MAG: 50S ribosomal protein L17 [Candidatus Omnitrophota bacterium]